MESFIVQHHLQANSQIHQIINQLFGPKQKKYLYFLTGCGTYFFLFPRQVIRKLSRQVLLLKALNENLQFAGRRDGTSGTHERSKKISVGVHQGRH